MSPTSTWGGPEPYADDGYSSTLLKYLLKQMMAQFSAQGACIALLDESIGQMVVRVHIRLRHPMTSENAGHFLPHGGPGASTVSALRAAKRRITARLNDGSSNVSPSSGPTRPNESATEDVEDVTPQQSELFAVGSRYGIRQDLIGMVWQKDEPFSVSHEEYIAGYHEGQALPFRTDITPSSYLVVPVQQPTLLDDVHGRKRAPTMLGVIVLYHLIPGVGFSFRQRNEALHYVEHIALYLQNERLQRSQRRMTDYLERLQAISTSFPTSVNLSDLIENMYQFASQTVDVSSMCLTLYDRDTSGIYDVFAVNNGRRVENLTDQPVISNKGDRPVWWQVAQREKLKLHFSPAHDVQETARYQELLVGAWGDLRRAESFLFLPMKMFNRTIGSLSLASTRAHAYHPEEIQVLETMVQIITVSIENVKLYERDRVLLHEAKEREGQLAAINSALQAISSVMNVAELLTSLAEKVATLMKADISIFFQPSSSNEELVATAMYGQTSFSQLDDGSDIPAIPQPRNPKEDEELIKLLRLPYMDTFLEHQAKNQSFFYLDAPQLEMLAQQRRDLEGATFLREMLAPKQQVLVIPLSYQSEFIGLLAVLTPRESRAFRPKEIAILLAICAQATSAIRNAQLFEQREETYAQLQRMDRLKDEFLVTASHELRTPLSAIIGYASLLKRQSARITSQHVLRFATKIGSASQQLLDLVENMTAAAQMGAVEKDLEFNISPVQVLSAAEIAANMVTMNVEQNIILNVDPTLWINGGPLHFRQVLSNLLDNAAKYSHAEGQITLSATPTTLQEVALLLPEDQVDHVLLMEQGQMPVVLIRVQDQGEGIRPEDQKRIFEKFVRAPRSLTTPVRGSGLGLYICRRYVEAMGGRLWLERSVANEGSTFSLYLPRTEPPVEIGDSGEYKAV
jgi:signal transduction histidine kinase